MGAPIGWRLKGGDTGVYGAPEVMFYRAKRRQWNEVERQYKHISILTREFR